MKEGEEGSGETAAEGEEPAGPEDVEDELPLPPVRQCRYLKNRFGHFLLAFDGDLAGVLHEW